MLRLCIFVIMTIQLFGKSESINLENAEKGEQIHTEYEENWRERVHHRYRQKRSLFDPNSPLMTILRNTPAENYKPFNLLDPFDFVRNPFGVIIPRKDFQEEYDFIIVGAGASGSVIASRLTEIEQFSVLLLEAGGSESILNDVPLMASFLQGTGYNWGYLTEKQNTACLGLVDQKCGWTRGKAVGGSSSINYMIYTRGFKADWDKISKRGNPGWSYNEVLPYFLKSERSTLRGLESSANHNRSGLMSIEDPRFRTPLADVFMKAANEFGYPTLADYNDAGKLGFGFMQANTLNGRRHSVTKAFLAPAKDRANLHISSYSRVTKINIDPVSKEAKSVEFTNRGNKHVIKARKEIILSAGAFESPHLLMLSGVGPKNQLEAVGIPVIKELKVGQTLYDHLTFPGLTFLVNQSGLGLVESEFLNVFNVGKWLLGGEGPLSIIGGIEAIGYIKTAKANYTNPNYPDIELLFVPAGLNSDASQITRRGLRLTDEIYNGVYKEILEKDVWSVCPVLLHPKSKGYLTLQSSDPLVPPKFYHNYYTNQNDLDTMVEAIKVIIRMSKTNAFQKYGSMLHQTPYPTCTAHAFGSDAYWACVLRSLTSTIHHQIATCKMGPQDDQGAVVDPLLRVHGIKNLRVADISVIPIPISAHTHAPAVMIGEKIADILKTTWNQLS